MSERSQAAARLELPVTGMTCAACAGRVERRLNQLEGVEASVNYATEVAAVSFDPGRVDPGDLVAAVRESGYDATLPAPGGHATEDPSAAPAADPLRTRLIWSAVLSVPVVLVSMFPALQFDNWQWVALQAATPVVLWGAWPFHRAAWLNLRHGAATMDTLVSIGTLAAWGWSVVAMLFFGAGEADMRMGFELIASHSDAGDHIYLEVAVAVTTMLLLGRWLEARAKRSAGADLRALMDLGAKDVAILDGDDREQLRPIAELGVGDRFVVRPGDRVATDGVVEEGVSAIDASLLTGESVPVEVGPGSEVAGAAINVGGRLIVRAIRVGEDTALAQIARLVREAQSGRAPVQRLADRISAVFVPVVILIAVATLAFWLANGAGAAFAFTAAVAVLIIACPCALGLATPTALLVGTGRGAQMGVLITGPQVLESTRRVDTVVLDKTGTVTTGQMRVIDVAYAVGEEDPEEVLRLVAALEGASEHPVGRAIAREAPAGRPPAVSGFIAHSGLGAEGRIDGHSVLAGRPSFVTGRASAVPPELQEAIGAATRAGASVVLAAIDGRTKAVFTVADTPKPTSAWAVERLRELGLRPLLLTGDNGAAAQAVADQVGIEDVVAEVLPEGKVAVIERLQGEGRVVAMIGDGVNDAPALAQADLGIALGTGTDVAAEASDLTLVSGDLGAAVDAVRLSRRTLAVIKGNLFWAFAYNVAAIPLAAAGYLNPVIAAAAMVFSSLFVVTNSLRLRRFRSERVAPTAPMRVA